jgi:pyruvate dehydrogenase E1 component
VWSVTSFNELRRDGLAVERSNRLHPGQKPKLSYVEECLNGRKGPVIASTDYMKLFAEQIRGYRPRNSKSWAPTVSAAATAARNCVILRSRPSFRGAGSPGSLADRGEIEPKVVAEAIVKFGIDPEKRNPLDC